MKRPINPFDQNLDIEEDSITLCCPGKEVNPRLTSQSIGIAHIDPEHLLSEEKTLEIAEFLAAAPATAKERDELRNVMTTVMLKMKGSGLNTGHWKRYVHMMDEVLHKEF